MRRIGNVYYSDKKQYNKALAWYILAAMENDSAAYHNIGALYHIGNGVPKNYLCALKWYLKAAEGYEYENTSNYIGKLFENGQGVPLYKYNALEWHCHGKDKTLRDKLKKQGFYLSGSDTSTFNYITDSLY
jgi:TPR repeat protein